MVDQSLPSPAIPGFDRLTAGAQRVVRQTLLLREGVEPNARDLLLAIEREEGLGRSILHRFDLTTETFRECPADRSEPETDMGPIRLRSPFEELIHLAIHAAGETGSSREAGTGHLLLAIANASGPVADWLASQDLTPNRIARELAAETGESTAPIPVDFELAPERDADDVRPGLFRLLDAAANRLREGLRTVEDHVRFILDDRLLTSELKSFRHDLTEAMGLLDEAQLRAGRQTENDIGTGTVTSGELLRPGTGAVSAAAWKRIQEALRSLEEYGKILSTPFARRIESLRYRSYTLEKWCRGGEKRTAILANARLYVLVTESLCRNGLEGVVRSAVDAGADVIQLREKSMPDRELLATARRVREWTRAGDCLFIMNDRPDLAVLCDADGVHVGQDELTVADARRIVGSNRLVGVSTHDLDQIREAIAAGADYIGVGPTFPGETKAFNKFAGLEFVREAAENVRLPWFAIGGIDGQTLPRVMEAGATRVAVSGVICRNEYPGRATGSLKDRLTRTESE